MKRSMLFAAVLAGSAALPLGARGAAQVPFVEDFTGIALNDMPDGWSAADINADGKLWGGYYAQMAITDFFTVPVLDDWLFTPAISFEEGKTYLVEFKPTRGYLGGNPFISLWAGDSQNPEDMTDELLADTELTEYFASAPTQVVLRCDRTADRVLGFHALSAADGACIQLDDVSVREATMPCAVTGLEVEKVGGYGSPDVVVRFQVPENDMSGNPLQSVPRIVVVRSGVQVQEIFDATPGELIEFSDNCPYGSGNYQWRVTCYDADGQASPTAETPLVFVGVNAPGIPGNLSIAETETPGTVTVTWDRVTVDRDGVPMPEEFIDYQLICNGSYIVASGAESPYTLACCEPDDQTFVTVQVVAKSSYGSGVAAAGPVVVGKPRTAFAESFDGGYAQTNLRPYADAEVPASWYTLDDAMLFMYSGITEGDADQTNGCAAIIAQTSGAKAGAHLGKYDLSAVAHPALTVYAYFGNVDEQTRIANILEVKADTGDGQGMHTVAAYDMSDDPETQGWRRVVFPLDMFKDTPVELELAGMIVNLPIIALDAIRVQNLCGDNLGVSRLTAPGAARPGDDFMLSAKVENTGTETTPERTATLLRDGAAIKSALIPALEPGHGAEVTFGDRLSLLDADEVAYTVRIDEADDDLSDNTSCEVVVSNQLPSLPAVSDLAAAVGEYGTVTLTWTEPELSAVPEAETESFESGRAGDINKFGDWTFYDNDGAPTYVVDDYDPLPGQGQPMAALLVDTEGHNSPYVAHTGSKMMAMQAADEMDTDDWMISPELTGDAQTVTFWARSYDQYGYVREHFSFMVSADSSAPEDFEPLPGDVDIYGVPGQWTEYTYELPEGTRFFAVNYAPAMWSGIMLMLDDFTFTSLASAKPLELLGYNLYCGGELLREGLAETSAVVDGLAMEVYPFQVTALYDRGESRGSNVAVADLLTVGVGAAAQSALTVTVTPGRIEIANPAAEPVQVTAVNGTVLLSADTSARISLAATPGLYLVKTPASTAKVLVP